MDIQTPFYGRRRELATLKRFLTKKSASMIILKGRRRIGKSRLIKEFAKSFERVYTFSGLAPTKKTTAQSQRDEFARQLQRVFGIPPIKADDWGDLFWFVGDKIKEGPVLLVLDEINWMGHLDENFLPQLKNAWDLYFESNPKLTLVLCGSLSAWIENNIMSSTGFMGRYSYDMTLRELPLHICDEFWRGKAVSDYEKFKLLAICGGVPRYLEFIDPNITAEENILHMGFEDGSILFVEFDKIFSDLFSKRSELYKRIVESLITGQKTRDEVADYLNIVRSGNLSEYLSDLVKSGIIARDYTWSIITGNESKLSRYRLSDNYSRFYLKYIEPNKNKILAGNYEEVSLSLLPDWHTTLGLQFENLVLNNRRMLKRLLKIRGEEIVYDNPYFQRAGAHQLGCQIDYIIQTASGSLYVFEFKFSRNKITTAVMGQVREKISRLNLTKKFSIRPVLVHVNGVENGVSASDFFVKIIDFGDFLHHET